MPYQDLSVGSAPAYPVYDDAVLRIARSTTAAKAARNTASDAAKPRVTFGSSVPSMGATSSSGNKVSFGNSVSKIGNLFSFFGSTADDYSLGTPVATYGIDDQRAAVSQGRAVPAVNSPVMPIPSMTTVDGDGSTPSIGGFKDVAGSIFAAMGSSGDDRLVTQASATSSNLPEFNPMWIAAAAVAAGVIYYAVAK